MNEQTNHLLETDLFEYLDDALPIGEKKRVETHLMDCESCQTQLDEFRTLFATIDAAGEEVSISRDLAPGVLKAISQPKTQPVAGILRWGLALQAILGIAIIALALPLINFSVSGLAVPTVEVPEEFSRIPEVFSTDLAMVIADANAIYTEGLSFLSELSGSPASMLGWASCIGIVFLLWVAGNTVLLNPRSQK